MKHKITLRLNKAEFKVEYIVSQVCVTGIMKYYYTEPKTNILVSDLKMITNSDFIPHPFNENKCNEMIEEFKKKLKKNLKKSIVSDISYKFKNYDIKTKNNKNDDLFLSTNHNDHDHDDNNACDSDSDSENDNTNCDNTNCDNTNCDNTNSVENYLLNDEDCMKSSCNCKKETCHICNCSSKKEGCCQYLTKTKQPVRFTNLNVGDSVILWVDPCLSYTPMNTVICVGETKVSCSYVNGGFKGIIDFYDCHSGKMAINVTSIQIGSLLGYDYYFVNLTGLDGIIGLTGATLTTPTITTPVISGSSVSTSYLDYSGTSATYANGATVDFSNFSGMIIVNNTLSTGNVQLWLCGGGTATKLGDSSSSTTQNGTIAEISGGGGYRWTNNTGASQSISFGVIRTRTLS